MKKKVSDESLQSEDGTVDYRRALGKKRHSARDETVSDSTDEQKSRLQQEREQLAAEETRRQRERDQEAKLAREQQAQREKQAELNKKQQEQQQKQSKNAPNKPKAKIAAATGGDRCGICEKRVYL